MIVDAQVHLWEENRADRPWPPGGSADGHRLLTAEDLLREMEVAGVDRAVLVPPSWEGERNDLVLAAAHAHPDRFVVMGRVPHGSDRATIETWSDDPAMKGIRVTCHRGPQRQWLTTPGGDWLWSAAERSGLPVMLFAPGLEMEVSRLLTRFPALRLTLDHVNLALSVGPESLLAAVERILPLADFPTLCVKATALECHVAPEGRAAQTGAVLELLIAAFGADRVFWGTDLTRTPCSYAEAVRLVRDELPLSDEERSSVLGDALRAWLAWP